MNVKVTNLEHATTAALDPRGAAAHENCLPCDEERITALARNAVEAYVLSGCVVEPPTFTETSPLSRPSACFVCIKTFGRELRGCIGTVEPEHATLAEEVIANAVKAATRDARFRPV